MQLNHVIEMAVNLKDSKNNFQKKNKESFYQANCQSTWATAGNHANTNIPRNHNFSNNYNEPSITKNNNLIYNCNNGGLYNQENAAYCMMSPYDNERKKKKINLMDY